MRPDDAAIAAVRRLADRTRQLLPHNAAPRRAVRAVRRAIDPRDPPTHALAKIIRAYGRAHPDAFFIQVGANDGIKADPLREEIEHRRWRGIMVEPVPFVFERLERHHGGNPRLVLENVAIADAPGHKDLYFLPESADADLPAWYDTLASFRREVIVDHHLRYIPDIAERVEVASVPCLTFDDLCQRHRVSAIDLVQMDTEGYDYEIIKLIDLDRYRPGMLIYERYHLDDETQSTCLDHLRRAGYIDISNPMDTLCLRITELRNRRLRTLLAENRGPDGMAVETY